MIVQPIAPPVGDSLLARRCASGCRSGAVPRLFAPGPSCDRRRRARLPRRRRRTCDRRVQSSLHRRSPHGRRRGGIPAPGRDAHGGATAGRRHSRASRTGERHRRAGPRGHQARPQVRATPEAAHGHRLQGATRPDRRPRAPRHRRGSRTPARHRRRHDLDEWNDCRGHAASARARRATQGEGRRDARIVCRIRWSAWRLFSPRPCVATGRASPSRSSSDRAWPWLTPGEQIAHLVVARRREVLVERTDRAKRFGRRHAQHVVGLGKQVLAAFG